MRGQHVDLAGSVLLQHLSGCHKGLDIVDQVILGQRKYEN